MADTTPRLRGSRGRLYGTTTMEFDQHGLPVLVDPWSWVRKPGACYNDGATSAGGNASGQTPGGASPPAAAGGDPAQPGAGDADGTSQDDATPEVDLAALVNGQANAKWAATMGRIGKIASAAGVTVPRKLTAQGFAELLVKLHQQGVAVGDDGDDLEDGEDGDDAGTELDTGTRATQGKPATNGKAIPVEQHTRLRRLRDQERTQYQRTLADKDSRIAQLEQRLQTEVVLSQVEREAAALSMNPLAAKLLVSSGDPRFPYQLRLGDKPGEVVVYEGHDEDAIPAVNVQTGKPMGLADALAEARDRKDLGFLVVSKTPGGAGGGANGAGGDGAARRAARAPQSSTDWFAQGFDKGEHLSNQRG